MDGSGTDRIDASENIPDVVLLDLGRDPEPFFAFGAQLREIAPYGEIGRMFTSLNPPNQQMLLDAMRSGVQDIISKSRADPVCALLGKFSQDSYKKASQSERHKSVEKLIVLMGSKGGVGTTTVAVNLGVQLSTFARKQVVLLDLARPLGNAHLMLDLNPRFGIRDAIENIDRLDSHFFDGLLTAHKTKLQILRRGFAPGTVAIHSCQSAESCRECGPGQLRHGPGRHRLTVRVGLDIGPRSRLLEWILLVTETNVPALWNLERRLSALEGLGINSEKVRIVVNRWHKGDQETLNSLQKTIKRRPIFLRFFPTISAKLAHPSTWERR